MKINDILSLDEITSLTSKGLSEDEIASHAKNVYTLKQQTPAVQKPANKTTDYILNSNSLGADFLRGAGTSALRLTSMADWGAEKLGFDLVDDKKLDKNLQLLDEKKESISRAGLSKERLAELEALDAESQKAVSVWDNVKAGANKMVDVALHPTEWTAQGIVEGVSDPLNLVSFGAGGLAARIGRNLLERTVVGGTAGLAEGAVVNSAGEYAVERGRGHSEEQAQKVAIQSASGGAVAGAAFGSLGGAVSKPTSKQHQNNSETISNTDDILNNPILKTDGERVDENGIIKDPFDKNKHPKVDEAYRVENTNSDTPPPPPNFVLVHENLPAVLNEIVDAEIIEPEAAKQISLKHQKLLENNVKVAGLQGWSESIGQDIVDAINAKSLKKIDDMERGAKEFKETQAQVIESLSLEGVAPEAIKEHLNSIEPTRDEAQLTLVINDGQKIENRFAGARLRESLLSAMEKQSVEPAKFYEIMVKAGAGENLAKVAGESYASRNIDTFDTYVSNKVIEAQEADNVVTKQNIKEQFRDIETLSEQYQNDIDLSLNELKSNKRFDELMEFAQELESKNTLSPQRLLQRGAGRELDGNGGTDKSTYDGAAYEPNYAHGFALTKAKVKRIQEGNPTKADLLDLESDLGIMEQSSYFNPPEFESIEGLNRYLQENEPETWAELQAEANEVFGNNTIKEIRDDTDRPSILARDSRDSGVSDTAVSADIYDGAAADVRVDGPGISENGGDGARLQSDNGILGDTAAYDGEQGDTNLYNSDAAGRANESVAGDRESARSGQTNGDGTQTKRGAESELGKASNASQTPPAAKDDVGTAASTSGLNLREKLELQKQAEDITDVVLGDIDSIAATLPMQLPHQQQNTLKAENRFFTQNKKGMMFTDGTGTGKTYTGLGIAKRMHKQGKENILIITPTDKKVKDWIGDGKNMMLDIKQLKGVDDAGEGVVATTYANFYQNEALLRRDFDLIIPDESHYLMQNSKGKVTGTTDQFFKVSNGNDYAIAQRAEMRIIPKEIRNFEKLNDIFKELGEKFGVGNRLWFDDNIQTLSDLDSMLENRKIILNASQKQEFFNRAIAQREAQNLYWDTKKELSDDIDAETAKIKEQDVKVLFLSATPFKGHFSLDYAMNYLFDVEKADGYSYNSGNGRDRFYIENFGYKMRYNKLTKPDAEVDLSVMERRFADNLKKEGSLSGYTIIGDKDYSREFVKVGGDVSDRMAQALDTVFNHTNEKYKELRPFIYNRFSDYLESNQMYEGLKAKLSLEMIQKHLDSGKQIVLFHRYKSGAPSKPFNFKGYSYKRRSLNGKETTYRLDDDPKAVAQLAEFEKEFSDVVGFDGVKDVTTTMREAFGDQVVYFNGDIPNKQRAQAVDDFNSGDKRIILIQEQAGKEGISLHDTVGDAQRVLINLALPYDPIAGIQIEGRTFRIGVESNAIYQYPILGLKLEEYQFGSLINKRLGTTENLALGSEARALADTFKESFINNIDESEAHLSEGIGGKERDRSLVELSEWEIAKSDYYSNAKKTSRNKASEGADYFATPEPLGFKMVEWADIRPNNDVLEPSAGHGAIARYFPNHSKNRMIEPSSTLIGKLSMRTKGDIVQSSFEDHNIINKYDTIVMNPPFGTAGKLAMEHIDKAYKHLKDGGRIVAIVPDGSSMQKRIDNWLYAEDKNGKLVNDASFTAEVLLPASTFERAGTKVIGRVIVIDKGEADFTRSIDLRDVVDNKELFDRLENLSIPERNVIVKDAEIDIEVVNNILDDSSIKIIDDVDTRDNSPLYVAQHTERLDRADFNKERARAKEIGGYYSRFKKGFIFANRIDADKFKSEGC